MKKKNCLLTLIIAATAIMSAATFIYLFRDRISELLWRVREALCCGGDCCCDEDCCCGDDCCDDDCCCDEKPEADFEDVPPVG